VTHLLFYYVQNIAPNSQQCANISETLCISQQLVTISTAGLMNTSSCR